MSEELKHTPEPWAVDDFTGNIIWDAKKQRVADIRGWGHLQKLGEDEGIQAQIEVANRIVNCVHACAGMADPQADILALRQEVENHKEHAENVRQMSMDHEEEWKKQLQTAEAEVARLREALVRAERWFGDCATNYRSQRMFRREAFFAEKEKYCQDALANHSVG